YGTRPALALKSHRAHVKVIIQIKSKKHRRSHNCPNHHRPVCCHPSAFDESAAYKKQDCASAVQSGIDDGKDGVLFRNRAHAAGFVVLRFAMKKAKPNMKRENKNKVAREEGSDATPVLPGNNSTRSASTPYVSGLASTRARIHCDAPVRGNNDPDSSHSGIRNRLMMAWNAWLESIGQAMAKPSAVSANETRNTVNT